MKKVTNLFDKVTRCYHLSKDDKGNLQHPITCVVGRRRLPSDGHVSSELPPVSKETAERLHKLVEGDKDEFMQAVLDAVTRSRKWLVDGPSIKSDEEIPKLLRPYIIWGDLARMVLETPNLSDEVQEVFYQELVQYKKELWDISNNYTIQHALWAAGHINHSVLDLLHDWRGRPRGKKFEMKSRLEKDLPLIKINRIPDLTRKPYAEVITGKEIGGKGKIYLFPWHYEEGPIQTDTLICRTGAEARTRLRFYIFG